MPQYQINDYVILKAARIDSHAPTTKNGPSYWVQFSNGQRIQVDERNIYRKKDMKDGQKDSHS